MTVVVEPHPFGKRCEVVQWELGRRARLELDDVEYANNLADGYQEHRVVFEGAIDMDVLGGERQVICRQYLE